MPFYSRSLLSLLLVCVTSAGFAQSTPNWVTGYVPPATEWNALWAGKQNVVIATNAASLIGIRATPLLWGAVGNGTTDDTIAVQAAINATSLLGIPLYVADGVHQYLISTGLTSAGVVDIEGFAPIGNDGVANAQKCLSGLFTTSNINMLTLTGAKATVRDVCIQMTPDATTSRTAGAAILLGGTDQQSDVISGNTIFRPYDGISFGGGATPNNLVRNSIAENNTIRDPARYGIAVGLNTSGGATAGITMRNNAIGCDGGYNLAGIGAAFFDGAVEWDGANTGPNNCIINMEIVPGTVNGMGQNINGEFMGVLGDSAGTHEPASVSHEIYIEPQTALGAVEFLNFTKAWAGGVEPLDNEILAANTHGGTCQNINFTGITAHSGPSQTVPIIFMNGCYNWTISGSKISAWPSGTTTGAGIEVGANSPRGAISGNFIGNEGAAVLATGIKLDSGAAFLAISGNEISEATVPISFTPTSQSNRVLFSGNSGVDDICTHSVASAATISIPNADSCIHVTGTTTVTSIANPYTNRQVAIMADNGVTFATGGPAQGMCAANVTIPTAGMASFRWNSTNQCWAHTP